ncbi:MAG: hypothetical protein QXS85_04540 [Acidilobaceae archaeon]
MTRLLFRILTVMAVAILVSAIVAHLLGIKPEGERSFDFRLAESEVAIIFATPTSTKIEARVETRGAGVAVAAVARMDPWLLSEVLRRLEAREAGTAVNLATGISYTWVVVRGAKLQELLQMLGPYIVELSPIEAEGERAYSRVLETWATLIIAVASPVAGTYEVVVSHRILDYQRLEPAEAVALSAVMMVVSLAPAILAWSSRRRGLSSA